MLTEGSLSKVASARNFKKRICLQGNPSDSRLSAARPIRVGCRKELRSLDRVGILGDLGKCGVS